MATYSCQTQVLGFAESFIDFAGSSSISGFASASNSDLEDFMGDDALPAPTRMRRLSPQSTSVGLSQSQSQPLNITAPSSYSKGGARSRAASDPFIDAPSSLAASRSYSHTTTTTLSSSPEDGDGESTNGPLTPQDEHHLMRDTPTPSSRHLPISQRPRTAESILSEAYLRTWTIPNTYTNPELHALLALFPSFITQRGIERFSVPVSTKSSSVTPALIESGLANGGEGKETEAEIRVGTGKMRKGQEKRVDGWRGGMWARFKEWFINMFG